jgi:hypothetical protein
MCFGERFVEQFRNLSSSGVRACEIGRQQQHALQVALDA